MNQECERNEAIILGVVIDGSLFYCDGWGASGLSGRPGVCVPVFILLVSLRVWSYHCSGPTNIHTGAVHACPLYHAERTPLVLCVGGVPYT